MKKHIVLAGAGHGHLFFLKYGELFFDSDVQITVIGPDRYHYYSGMGPGLLSGIYEPSLCRFDIRHMTETRGGRFITDRVTGIDRENRLVLTGSSGDIRYDIVSFNTGSVMTRPMHNPEQGIFDVKPVSNLLVLKKTIEDRFASENFRCLVLGGGFAGIECAFSIKHLAAGLNSHAEIVITESSPFLQGYGERFRKCVMKELSSSGIEIRDQVSAEVVRNNEACFSSGRSFRFDIAVNATGISPSPIFGNSGLPVHSDGSLIVNSFLQSPGDPAVLGTGDCIYFTEQPLRKAGVYAVRQAPVVAQNITALLRERPLKQFVPQKNYLKILNTGSGRGIFYRSPFIFTGRAAFMMKDMIDRKFMNRYIQPYR